MIVAGLDLSLTNAGIAVLTDGRPTLLRSVGHGGHNGASHAHRSRRIVSQTRAIIDVIATGSGANPLRAEPWNTRIDLAVIEGPSYDSKFGHSFDRAGLWWGVYSALLARKIPIAVIPPTSLKIWTVGKGNATKDQMLETVREWYPATSIRDHDAADALALACVGAFHLGEPMPFEVKARHESSLEKVEWPSRDETNNPVVSQTDTDAPNVAHSAVPIPGIAITDRRRPCPK